MQHVQALIFSAQERSTLLALAVKLGAQVHFDSPDPHPELPTTHQLGEYAQIVSEPPEDGDEPVSFTVQTTGDPARRFVRLSHTGHPQATGRTLDEALRSLLLAYLPPS
ncbi:MAG TPA: hypothetical protein VNO84_14165 [Burkholderiaceae bacterium]|nr:hypothetical protein [Burkholderiaceae bacterium]